MPQISPRTWRRRSDASGLKRVLIRTLPLGHNYGNILQAYALQEAVRAVGGYPVVDVSQSEDGRPSVPSRESRMVKSTLMRFGYSKPEWLAAAMDRRLHRFVSQRIETARLYTAPGRTDGQLVRAANVFLAGSDQVWRAPYGDVRSFLFDFLPGEDSRPRYSYAASYGRDDIEEYGPDLLRDSRVLAGRFSGVSVREMSGVRVAHEGWGVDAVHHLDPTMLLERSRYTALAGGAADALRAGCLVDYVLDASDMSQRLIADIGEARRLDRISLPSDVPDGDVVKANPEQYVRPSVEAWLGAIGNAGLVVTDSFHGTVFSIIHNVPFVTIVNNDRGASRFEDLLDVFGLRSRMVGADFGDGVSVAREEIDWRPVNERLDSERSRAFSYLVGMVDDRRA